MGLWAQRCEDDEEAPAATGGSTVRRTGGRAARPAASDRRAWNVLAEEIVAYPPAHRRIFFEEDARRSAVEVAPAPRRSSEARISENGTAGGAPSLGSSAVPSRAPLASSGSKQGRLTVRAPRPSGERVAASRPRGLRRLLPGAATLAALGGLWIGASAVGGHQHADKVLAGSVRSGHGYVYVVRPGDTLWSIASRLQPGGDPRPLVADLESQLGGAALLPGDRLHLP
ncbi:MAG: LysM peptidoglycan-binding domain-containing protein [Acidimicrobiales bacterium]